MPPRRLEIKNAKGLHARAAAKFVDVAGRFDATLEVSKDGQTVGGTSIMGLLLLAASLGSEIEISADGPEASQALEAITVLVNNRFDEEA